jgi:hypothetical protein
LISGPLVTSMSRLVNLRSKPSSDFFMPAKIAAGPVRRQPNDSAFTS